ncbi:MAG: extracellular solute-binding protein [Clostridia bacterium]|nr:extracellular solute-binding protein [Clostridia bacterium]
MKKRIFALSCAALLVTSCSLTACGGTGESYDPLDPDQIKVVVSNLGFGTDQFFAIAEAFENTHPGKTVVVEETILSDALISQLEAGSFIGDICMFSDDALWKKWRSGIMTQLDDVVSATPDGEEKTVGQKTDQTLINGYKVADGHYYSVPWINENTSYVYNETVLNTLLGENAWELPKTTEELFVLCDRIQDAGGYGFVWNDAYFGVGAYQAQYNGLETNNRFNQGEYWDETAQAWRLSDAENVQCYAMNEGNFRATKILEKIAKEYSHQYSYNMTFMFAQSTWAGIPYSDDSKLVAFMPNGDWVYNETKESLDDTGHEVGFMQMPVISDIVDQLSLYEHGDTPFYSLSEADKATYDTTLRAIVDYVDGDTQTVPTYKNVAVSEADIEIVREARSLLCGKCQGQAFIPSNSTKSALAKEFLVFMASDMAVRIYSQNTNGLSPYVSETTFDSISFDSKFMNEVLDVLSVTKKTITYYSDVRTSGFYYPRTSYAQAFDREKITAEALRARDLAYFKEQWPTILKNAGLAD